MSQTHTIIGSIIAPTTKKGISGLKIETWEQDVKHSDFLCQVITPEDGTFQFTFDESQRKDNYKDQNPIVFFREFDEEKCDEIMFNDRELT